MPSKNRDQWNVRVPEIFRQWAESVIKKKGLDKARCTAAAVMYFLQMPEPERECLLEQYDTFLKSGCKESQKISASPDEFALAASIVDEAIRRYQAEEEAEKKKQVREKKPVKSGK